MSPGEHRPAVFLDREAFVLGSAAAHFPVTWELPVPETPTMEQVAAFIEDYVRARGTALSRSERADRFGVRAASSNDGDPEGASWRGSSREELRNNGQFDLG